MQLVLLVCSNAQHLLRTRLWHRFSGAALQLVLLAHSSLYLPKMMLRL
jgi:hypothetical protein